MKVVNRNYAKILFISIILSSLVHSVTAQNLDQLEFFTVLFFQERTASLERVLGDANFKKTAKYDYSNGDSRIAFGWEGDVPRVMLISNNEAIFSSIKRQIESNGVFAKKSGSKTYYNYKNFICGLEEIEGTKLKTVFMMMKGQYLDLDFSSYYVQLYSEQEARQIYNEVLNLSTDSLHSLLSAIPKKLQLWEILSKARGSDIVNETTYDYHALLGDLASYILNKRTELTDEDYFNTGWLMSIVQNHRMAIEDYTKSLEIYSPKSFPTRALVLASRAESKFILGDNYGALNDFDEAINLEKNFHNYFGRGKVYYTLEKHQEAINDLSRALRIVDKDETANETLVEIYMKRGISFLNINNKQAACVDFSRAGELGSTYAYDLIRQECN